MLEDETFALKTLTIWIRPKFVEEPQKYNEMLRRGEVTQNTLHKMEYTKSIIHTRFSPPDYLHILLAGPIRAYKPYNNYILRDDAMYIDNDTITLYSNDTNEIYHPGIQYCR